MDTFKTRERKPRKCNPSITARNTVTPQATCGGKDVLNVNGTATRGTKVDWLTRTEAQFSQPLCISIPRV